MKDQYATNSYYSTYTFWENVLFELGSERVKVEAPSRKWNEISFTSSNVNISTPISFAPHPGKGKGSALEPGRAYFILVQNNCTILDLKIWKAFPPESRTRTMLLENLNVEGEPRIKGWLTLKNKALKRQ